MAANLWVQSITFSDGTVVGLSRNDIVLFVGPNNCGKSEALRGIHRKVGNKHTKSPVIIDIDVRREGTDAEVADWVRSQSARRPGDQEIFDYRSRGGFYLSQIPNLWKGPTNSGDENAVMREMCSHLLDTRTRLQLVGPIENKPLESPADHPIHSLQRSRPLEVRIAEKFKEAFGLDLAVNRGAGSQVLLHVGLAPSDAPFSMEYAEALRTVPKLHEQGDGMQAFAGILLNTAVDRHFLQLIDEPEAFLHPPQAHFLARSIAGSRVSQQLFLATHSGDVVRGFLETSESHVHVIRLEREGTVNRANELHAEAIAAIWQDPLLRYSNILDGLFHDRVVICESDSDCQFFSAVLTSLPHGGGRAPQVMFTHCGGKARVPMVARALNAVKVPISIVCDFDVLNAERPLRDIVEATGNSWSDVEKDWRILWTSVDKKKPELTLEALKAAVMDVVAALGDVDAIKTAKARITEVLKKGSAWSQAKSVGLSFIPNGDATQAANRLFAALHAMGIFVVPCGELEQFCKSVGSHGPAWTNQVLRKPLASDPELDAARAFVKQITYSEPGVEAS